MAPFYNIEIPDVEYWMRQVECQYACPVLTDACGYCTATARGEYELGYILARLPNPFASICGWVCGAPCEPACRRGDIDAPITIRPLKRFLNEQYGVEAADIWKRHMIPQERRPQKVAVIGGGVTGLTAAHDLALLGYQVTLFEAADYLGGLLWTGVPKYRLRRRVIEQEIQAIIDLGIEVHLGTFVGQDITMAQLQKDYQAVIVTVGLTQGRELNIPGGDLPRVMKGIEYLRKVILGEPVDIGDQVVIIGGGNVSFDVARSTVRYGQEEMEYAMREDLREYADVARTAKRAGAREVHLVCLESLEVMPADSIEIEEGMEEGIMIHPSRGPKRIVADNGRVVGLETLDVASLFDENKRFSPKFVEGSEKVLACDTVLLAIGQRADFTFLKGLEELKVTPRGVVEVNPQTNETNLPGVFAAGDIVTGPRLFIDGIASGQKAARGVHDYINGKRRQVTLMGKFTNLPWFMRTDNYTVVPRNLPPILPPQERVQGALEQEKAYPEAEAREQGRRCLDCHVQTIFHGERCIRCNGCVDVCPTHCLKMVSLSEMKAGEEMVRLVAHRYNLEYDELKEGLHLLDDETSAMIKDEELCIRCGFCSKRCPVEAVTMEAFEFWEKVEWEKQ